MFQIKSHMHHMYIKYLQNKELDDLYLSVFLKRLGESFITLFIPIYLFTLGYGVRDMAIYFLIHYIVIGMFIPIFMKLCAKIGIKKVMAIGSILLLISYYFLNQIEFGLSYFIPSLLTALSSGAYYAAFHINFTKVTAKKKEAKKYSILKIIAIISASLGPFIGSFIIEEKSFTIAFIVAAILVILSIIPLFITKDYKIKNEKISFKKIINADSSKKAMAYRASGATSVANADFWPLFIFITLGTFVSLGTIFSFSSIIMIFLISYIGKIADTNAKRTFKIGIISQIPLWIIRLLLITPIGFFITNFLNEISKSIIDISFNKIVYHNAGSNKNIISYFTFRELNLAIGRIIILIIVILITFFITNTFHIFIIIFMISGIMSLLYFVLLRNHNVNPKKS